MIDDSLSFSSGSQSGDMVCTNISIFDDLAFEKEEDFFVHVSTEPDVIIDDEYAIINIIDNDCKYKNTLVWYYPVIFLCGKS